MFKKLRCFIVTANTGSFTKAAKELYMTQPAVSQQVTSLEKSVGVELFERTSHGLELTAAGKALAEQVSPHINEIEMALARISSPGVPSKQSLTMYYRGSADDALAVPLLKAMAAEHPDVSFRLERYKNNRSKLALLADGEADIALFKALPEGIPEGLGFIPLAYTALTAVVPLTSTLIDKQVINLDDLLTEPVNITEDLDAHVLLAPRHSERRHQNVQNVLRTSHEHPELLRSVPDTQSAITSSKAGFGISLINSGWIRNVDGVVAIPFEPENRVEYGMYYSLDNNNPALAPFIECAKELFIDIPFFAPGGKLVRS